MEIVVKVDRRRVKNPATHVTTIVHRAAKDTTSHAHAEEIFPDLQTGRSAGLVSLELPDDVPVEESDRILQALRSDEAVEYAHLPARRTVK